MIVKTKKFKLETSDYIKLALKNVIKDQWWVIIIIISLSGSIYFFNSLWFLLIPLIGLILYFGFWLLQFYGVTMMDQSKLIFEKVNYEISGKQIIIYLSSKQGIPIEWNQIKKVIIKNNYFLFIISRAHIIYLPYKIFNSENAVKFVEAIIKRKKLN